MPWVRSAPAPERDEETKSSLATSRNCRRSEGGCKSGQLGEIDLPVSGSLPWVMLRNGPLRRRNTRALPLVALCDLLLV